MTLVLRLSNSGLSLAMYPSSVVHTGVKSFGCENRIAHESPIQSWKWISPSVVRAKKSGAVSPIVRAMSPPWCRFPQGHYTNESDLRKGLSRGGAYDE